MKKHLFGRKILALALAAALLAAAAPSALAWERRGEYREGLATVTDGSRWGYVDGAGSLVISLQYSAAEAFHLGLAKVSVGGKQGLVRQDGIYVLEPEFDAMEDMGYGLWAAKRNGAWSLVSVTEIPIWNRLVSGNAHALYEGASFIGWEQRAVLMTPEPTQAPAETAEPEEGAAEPPASPVEDGEAAYDISPAPEVSPTPAPVYVNKTELVIRWEERGQEVRLEREEVLELLRLMAVPGWSFALDAGRTMDFSDVSPRDWFGPWVDIVYSVGLMEGRGDGQFQPLERLMICEALKLVALMDCRYIQGETPVETVGQDWYSDYLRYCLEQGIVLEEEFDDLSRPITRAELALLISRTSLFAYSEDVNDLALIREAVPDVKAGDYAAEAIFGLYAKGVLTGYGPSMTFRPDAPITRAEVSAMVARMVRPEQRAILHLDSVSDSISTAEGSGT